ncbi:nucleotide-diphospho-sugar transferase [Arcticibacter eurypsychrophilus]|uniref:nucleotide-diphospho-sugar transferase n=1 Tax=Arcticibacter eurypsychrophilus TaxID=1434752 RepID=UPI00084DA14C|nr:nucleotide-diphospho-sugar transferase [Arcticibacter eurypsychrophilus]
MTPYTTTSAVLFILFKRPDTTIRVFEKIREARPSKLYLAADGPHVDNVSEIQLCKETREIIGKIDWPCQIKILFREENLGCKYAVSSSLDWFFKNEEEGIILEDDCLPSNDFFRFCDQLLFKYRNDTRVRMISGDNFQFGRKWGNASYYFSNNIHVWGWASWRRAWQDYDVELCGFKEDEIEEQLGKIFNEPLLIESWKNIFVSLKRKEIDTWDYQLGLINFFNNGLCIIPNVNLISNIGFRSDATHTVSDNDLNANIPVEPLAAELIHPVYILPEKGADLFTWYSDFNIEERKALAKKDKSLNKRIRKLLRLN